MKPISNRYEPKRLLSPLLGGMLYEGKDLSLQRTVFIYTIDIQGESDVSDYIRSLGNAAVPGAAESPFLHVLDAEVGSGTIHVIVSYKPGCPLRQYIRGRAPSFRAALTMAGNLGQALLDAAEERLLDFSIEADNVWVTDDGVVNIINTWDRAPGNQRLSKGLAELLFHLLTGSEHFPDDAASFESLLRANLNGLSAAKQDEIVHALSEAWSERLTLAAFVRYIRSFRHAPGPVMPTEPIRRPTSARAAPVEPVAPIPASRTNMPPQAEDETAAFEEEEPVPRRRLLQFGKKLWIGLSLSALGLAVFVGVFVLLIETMNRGPKTAPPQETVADLQPPSPAPSAPQKQPDTGASDKKESPAKTDGTLVGVPTLTGLTQEAAEKLAVDSGLRYSYFLESADHAAGTVFKQEPAPKEQVEKGSRVTFWVSKGPAKQ
ncbi:PASTA domain-containing protein [Paenibacillus sp. GYB003]|uniref:PASTA domain-containing protein n=1 Tax=Paenibacillus sp. GYB003 TaxID=2994392 RepID=UPI002F96E051